jgi:hypothetical protein
MGFSDWTNVVSLEELGTTARMTASIKRARRCLPGWAHGRYPAAWAANEADYLYLRLDLEGDIDMTAAAYSLYLDLDRSSRSGYKTSWSRVGAEYRIQNGVLYQYNGDGTNWSWVDRGRRSKCQRIGGWLPDGNGHQSRGYRMGHQQSILGCVYHLYRSS